MATFYAYDADFDTDEDCADLGAIEAANAAEALEQAKAIWPEIENIRVA